MKGLSFGQHRMVAAGVPALAGVVEHVSHSPRPCTLLRLDQPTPGVAALFTMLWGDSVMAAFTFYVYGDQATATVAREKPLWQT